MPSDLSPLTDGGPRRSRPLWLLAPYALLILLAAGWSVAWFVVKGQVERRLDQSAQELRRAGWSVALDGRRLSGFPFRLKLAYPHARLGTPTGWAVDVPGLQAEAYLHAPDHWVLVAPAGLTFIRPLGGPVAVSGRALRASLAGLRQPIWRVVLEAAEPRFTAAEGARPFALASAELMQLYVQPSATAGEARTLLRIEGGRAASGTLLSVLAQDKPVVVRTEARVTGLASRQASIRTLQLDLAELHAGAVGVRLVQPTSLIVAADGRLRGEVPIEVRPALATLAALTGIELDPAAARRAAELLSGRGGQGDAGRLTLSFQGGSARLGPLRLGPSPRLF